MCRNRLFVFINDSKQKAWFLMTYAPTPHTHTHTRAHHVNPLVPKVSLASLETKMVLVIHLGSVRPPIYKKSSICKQTLKASTYRLINPMKASRYLLGYPYSSRGAILPLSKISETTVGNKSFAEFFNSCNLS